MAWTLKELPRMKTSTARITMLSLALSGAYLGTMAAPAHAGAIITTPSGLITMGIRDLGDLNEPFQGDPLGIGYMGLRYNPTNAASTEPGCTCEGWGVSNGLNWFNSAGYANSSVGTDGLSLNSFTSTSTTALSDVTAAGIFQVVH